MVVDGLNVFLTLSTDMNSDVFFIVSENFRNLDFCCRRYDVWRILQRIYTAPFHGRKESTLGVSLVMLEGTNVDFLVDRCTTQEVKIQ